MRIGIRLVGRVAGAIVAVMAATSAPGAEADEQVQPVPLGGSLTGQTGEQYFGVYVPTRFGGALTVKSTAGKVETDHGPRRPRAEERRGGRHRQARLVHLQGDRAGEGQALRRRDHLRPGRPEHAGSPGTSITGRPSPTRSTSPGPAATPGSTRCSPCGDDELVAQPGGYIAPGQDIVRAGPNGLLETPVAPGDDLTWFPNLYDDLTLRGTDGTLYADPLAACSSTTRSSAPRPGTGRRPTARTRTSSAGRATASAARSPRSS